MTDWKPIEVDFTLTKEETAEMWAAPDPEAWFKAHIRKKYNLPDSAEIDLSGIKVERVKESSEE